MSSLNPQNNLSLAELDLIHNMDEIRNSLEIILEDNDEIGASAFPMPLQRYPLVVNPTDDSPSCSNQPLIPPNQFPPSLNFCDNNFQTMNKKSMQKCYQTYNSFDECPGPLPKLATATQGKYTGTAFPLQKSSRSQTFRQHRTPAKDVECVDDFNFEDAQALFEQAADEIDKEENNSVFRIFKLFKKLDYFLNAKLNDNDDIDIRDFSTLPPTMNVQFQVKHASRKCVAFLNEMQHILNANKLKDRRQYEECERSLNEMRNILSQFESFKRIDMEHRQNEFVTEEAKVQSQYLEICLIQLCDLVRVCHIGIYVFNWAMEEREIEQHQLVLMHTTQQENPNNQSETCVNPNGNQRQNGQRDCRFIG